MPFWRSKFRIKIKKTRPTKTGTLRISHAISTLARGQISREASRKQTSPRASNTNLKVLVELAETQKLYWEKNNTRSGINLMIQVQTKAKTLGHIENNPKL